MRVACLLLLIAVPSAAAERYVADKSLASADATQAACADDKFVYAISNTRLVKFDRATGKELGRSEGEAFHLNSGLIHDGKVYCAHSYYPTKPNDSDIRVLDPATMKLTIFHQFSESPGSLTWALPVEGGWWCCFAHYGDANGKTVLIDYDRDWKERRRWTFPAKLVADWGGSSLSGGIRDGQTLLATGHDKKAVYCLKVPEESGEVEWLSTLESPFPGQGIAHDPVTGGLVGIDRTMKKVIFATRQL